MVAVPELNCLIIVSVFISSVLGGNAHAATISTCRICVSVLFLWALATAFGRESIFTGTEPWEWIYSVNS